MEGTDCECSFERSQRCGIESHQFTCLNGGEGVEMAHNQEGGGGGVKRSGEG